MVDSKKKERVEAQNSLSDKREKLKATEIVMIAAEKELAEKRIEFSANEKIIKEQKRKLQEITGDVKAIPECPVCFESMSAETQIFNCKNGHLVCGACKPRLEECATCRDGQYICRATAVEQIVRDILE